MREAIDKDQWRSQEVQGVLKPPPTTLASMEAPHTNFVEEEYIRKEKILRRKKKE